VAAATIAADAVADTALASADLAAASASGIVQALVVLHSSLFRFEFQNEGSGLRVQD
jgi:hypothetical protein